MKIQIPFSNKYVFNFNRIKCQYEVMKYGFHGGLFKDRIEFI